MGLADEGIRAFGMWEPLAHWLRNRGREEDHRIEDIYAWCHTEDFVRGLKDRGFNLVITQFSKGYGIETEARFRDDTKRLADLCHKHGMYAGGYVRYSTLVPETMKYEEPGCVERFASRTIFDTPSRYGCQYWRFMPCPSSTEFLEYLDRLIAIGVEQVGLDCLHVDGIALSQEPFTCHCPRCHAGFRGWLEQRYPTADEQISRFGFAGFDHVELPDYRQAPEQVWVGPMLYEPVAQEWIFFRCSLLEKIWRSIVDSAHKRNPACIVQGNTSFYPHLNVACYSAVEIHRLVDCGSDGFFTEEEGAPNITEDGRLHGYFQTFKLLRRLGFQVFTYHREPDTYEPITDPDRLRRSMAHQMAFDLDSAGVFSHRVMPGKWPPVDADYMAFHRDRRDLFKGSEQAHDVLVWYSDRTRTINCGTPIVTASLANDVLVRAHVPFGWMLAERRGTIADARAVVLPEIECMTGAEAADLSRFVRSGGGLLVLGADTGAYDELGRLHRTNVLSEALGLEWSKDAPQFTARVDEGRVAFLPGLVPSEGTPADIVAEALRRTKPYFQLNPTAWHLPRNGADLVNLLRWCARGFRFELVVPDTTVVEFVRQPARGRYLVHLVNFDLDRDVGPFEIALRGIGEPSGVEVFTPDGPAPLATCCDGEHEGDFVLRLPGMHRYLVVAVGTK